LGLGKTGVALDATASMARSACAITRRNCCSASCNRGAVRAQAHLAVLPVLDVAAGAANALDHALTGVSGLERLLELAIDAEPGWGHGQRLLETFAQRSSGAQWERSSSSAKRSGGTGPASPEDTAATSELLWPASCRYAGDGMGRGERSPYGTHNPQSDPLRSLERVTLRHRHQDFAVDRVSVGQSVRRATAIPCSDAQTCFAVARCATAAANESG
jgi:hypothetical protein